MDFDTRRFQASSSSSSPDLVSASTSPRQHPVDQSFVGVTTNVKLLLKLIHEYNEASIKGHNGNRDQRLSEMTMLIDDIKTQIHKTQSLGRRREAELRRCNTDVRRNPAREKKPSDPIIDEKEKLRKELNASLAARKSLELICSSIGKEKEIIAKELTRTVQQLQGMEELVNDLKAQNEMLIGKVQSRVGAGDYKVKKISSSSAAAAADAQGNIDALQKRNKSLSEQLLKSVEAYRSVKRKLRDIQERNNGVGATMEEMGLQVRLGLNRLNNVREMMMDIISEEDNNEQKQMIDMEMEITALQHMFEGFDIEISKHVNIKTQPFRFKNDQG